MSSPLVPTRFPRVPLWRRGAAFGFDFGIAWFLSFAGGTLGVPLFLLVWFGLRVALPIRNHGQSPGRWAFNLSLIYERFDLTPNFFDLLKRESIAGLGAVLLMLALTRIDPGRSWVLLWMLPLLADCSLAFAGPPKPQAFHDRVAHTLVIGTRRGYALDLRLQRWAQRLPSHNVLAEMMRRVKR